jgi:hypothetical protein
VVVRRALAAAAVSAALVLGAALPAQAWWAGSWSGQMASAYHGYISFHLLFKGYNDGGRTVEEVRTKKGTYPSRTAWLCVMDTLNGGAGWCTAVHPIGDWTYADIPNVYSADSYVYVMLCDTKGPTFGSATDCGSRAQIYLAR